MKFYQFTLFLFLSALLSSIVLGLFNPSDPRSLNFLFGVVGFFTLFCLILFMISSRIRNSKNLYLFSRVFLVSVFFKIFLFVAIIVVAIQKWHLIKQEIILPSLFIYLIFTIYETYFLMKMSKVY